MTAPNHDAGGPFFDDLHVGQVFESAPAMTLTAGAAATHQAIIGDRLRLALDSDLAVAVTGASCPLAHPALVCDTAIGQSTIVTQGEGQPFLPRAAVSPLPRIGDTLSTRTEIVAMKQNSAKPGRTPTGLAALRMTDCGSDGTTCPGLLPMRDAGVSRLRRGYRTRR